MRMRIVLSVVVIVGLMILLSIIPAKAGGIDLQEEQIFIGKWEGRNEFYRGFQSTGSRKQTILVYRDGDTLFSDVYLGGFRDHNNNWNPEEKYNRLESKIVYVEKGKALLYRTGGGREIKWNLEDGELTRSYSGPGGFSGSAILKRAR